MIKILICIGCAVRNVTDSILGQGGLHRAAGKRQDSILRNVVKATRSKKLIASWRHETRGRGRRRPDCPVTILLRLADHRRATWSAR